MSTRKDFYITDPSSKWIHSVGTGGTGLSPQQLMNYMNNLGIMPIVAPVKPISPPVQFVKKKKNP
jgi:hypothetical protein